MFEIMQRVQPEKKIKTPTKSAKNLAYSVKLRMQNLQHIFAWNPFMCIFIEPARVPTHISA
jgi:hypothetical protein